MFRSSALRLAALIVAATPLPALACSVEGDYRLPTNLELVQGADLILLGKVIGEEGGVAEEPWNDALLVQPLAALKGDLPAGTVKLPGMGLLADTRYLALSNPYDFADAHPLSYIGGCIRYMFPLGGEVLFFLKPGQMPGSWVPASGPFTRWAEDVPASSAPWAALTTIYTHAASLPEGERAAWLEGERASLSARADDPVALLMAADIARQIAGPEAQISARLEAEEAMADAINAAADAAAGAGGPSTVETTLEAMRRSDSK